MRACRNLLLVALLASCLVKPEAEPKPRTEAEVRALLHDEASTRALATLKDPTVRASLERAFRERAREVARRGRNIAVEKALVSENIAIGNGLTLARVFTLFHEYDTDTFTTFLNATEHVGGRIRLSIDARVGAPGERLAEIELVELDRALLRVSVYTGKDARCCPSKLAHALFGLRGVTLEALD